MNAPLAPSQTPSQTRQEGFAVGGNLATTPCIDKFYVLDLPPDNSLIQYLLGKGLGWSAEG